MEFPLYRRRTVLGAIAGLGAASQVSAFPSRQRRPGIAITIDDFDLTDTALLTGAERDTWIRATLARHRIKAAGFVAGKYIHGH